MVSGACLQSRSPANSHRNIVLLLLKYTELHGFWKPEIFLYIRPANREGTGYPDYRGRWATRWCGSKAIQVRSSVTVTIDGLTELWLVTWARQFRRSLIHLSNWGRHLMVMISGCLSIPWRTTRAIHWSLLLWCTWKECTQISKLWANVHKDPKMAIWKQRWYRLGRQREPWIRLWIHSLAIPLSSDPRWRNWISIVGDSQSPAQLCFVLLGRKRSCLQNWGTR